MTIGDGMTPLPPADVKGKMVARRMEVLSDGVCDAVLLTLFQRSARVLVV